MEHLVNRPDILFLIAVRYEELYKLTIIPKMRRDIYKWKTLRALTQIVKGVHFKEYYLYGQLHREDGPAVIQKMGNFYLKSWYYKGKLHRDGGPAEINELLDTEIWAKNGKFHRDDGPAWVNMTSLKARSFGLKDNTETQLDAETKRNQTENANIWFLEGVRLSEDEFNAIRTGVITLQEIKSKQLGRTFVV